MQFLFRIGGVIIAMRLAKKHSRNQHTWGAFALLLPLVAIIILLILGKKKTNNTSNLIDGNLSE
ncbi:MAG: hypothetical protein CMP61_07835 [Flavobacteriales bacterium]|nr:hypothetical protein [Flavobacteriales bacterium]